TQGTQENCPRRFGRTGWCVERSRSESLPAGRRDCQADRQGSLAVKRLLLDTSAYAAFMRGDEEAVQALREADEIYLNAIVLGEMLAGFMGGGRQDKNEKELTRFLESPRVNLIDVNESTAERYAVIFTTLRKAGTPIP